MPHGLGEMRGFDRYLSELGDPQTNKWNFLETEEEQLGELLLARSNLILTPYRQDNKNWKKPFEATYIRAKYLKHSNYKRISEAGSLLMKENYALFDVYKSNNGKRPRRKMSGCEFLVGVIGLIAEIAPYVSSGQGDYDAETAQAEFKREQARRADQIAVDTFVAGALVGTTSGW